MDKILIGLQVPAVGEWFDIFVPVELDISTVTKLLADGVAELCGGRYICSGQEMLVRKEPATLLDPNRALAEYGIRDGEQLVLF